MIMSIKVTSTPTLICGIANGISLRVTCSFDYSTRVLTSITCISIGSVGKDATQEIVIGFSPLLINSNLSLLLPTDSSYELAVAIIVSIGTSIILLLIWSYL